MNFNALTEDCIKRLSDNELSEVIFSLEKPIHDSDSPIRKLTKTIYGENHGVYFLRMYELLYPLLKETHKRWKNQPIIQESFKQLVDEGLAEFIGEGKWINNSAYQIYKYGERYFVWMVCNLSPLYYVLENTLCEIEEKNIGSYLENWK
jgi:hypothetical protein